MKGILKKAYTRQGDSKVAEFISKLHEQMDAELQTLEADIPEDPSLEDLQKILERRRLIEERYETLIDNMQKQ